MGFSPHHPGHRGRRRQGLRPEARRLPAEHQPRRQEGLLGPRRLLRRRRRPGLLGTNPEGDQHPSTWSRARTPIETYHITWSPDMKYLTFTRGPKFKGKSLKGLLPEFPGVEAPGWNMCVADATQKNRWVAITTRRQVVQAAELGHGQGGGGEMMIAGTNAVRHVLPSISSRLRCRALGLSEGRALRRHAGGDCRRSRPKSGVEMVLIPAGSFEMGSRHGREEEKPVHTVWIDSFLMDRHEVTQAEYEKLGKIEAFPNPSHFKGPDLPVEQVTWPQAARFCNARSRSRDSSRATTRTPASATSRPTATGCPPRPNGNTPAGPARTPTTRSAATRGSSATTPGSPTTPPRRRIPSARRSPIPGACSTCTATWPSGATMSTTRTITRPARTKNPRGPADGKRIRPARRLVEIAGRCRCGRPTGSARPRASPTPAWPAMPSASAACASAPPSKDAG